MVDNATGERIPIVLGAPQRSLLGPLLFILYTSEMLALVKNRLYAYADDSTLLTVVRELADRPAVAASLSREFTKIQERCDHWCFCASY